MGEMAMGLARGHEGSRKTMTVPAARGTLPQGFRGLNPVHVLAEQFQFPSQTYRHDRSKKTKLTCTNDAKFHVYKRPIFTCTSDPPAHLDVYRRLLKHRKRPRRWIQNRLFSCSPIQQVFYLRAEAPVLHRSDLFINLQDSISVYVPCPQGPSHPAGQKSTKLGIESHCVSGLTS